MLKVLTFLVASAFASNSMAEFIAPVSTEKSLVEIHVNKY